jgi:hypothetical protein
MALASGSSHLEMIADSATPTPFDLPGQGFGRLGPGEQRIVRALHDAQVAGGTTSSCHPSQRSLDDIAQMTQSGAGWNQIFRQLKQEGLLAEQTLGHVIARSTRPREGVGPATAHLASPPHQGTSRPA